MKNILKMLENSSMIYENRANLVNAVNNSKSMESKCTDLLKLLRRKANAYDVQNAFDGLIITDETVRSFANYIDADVEKQFNGITEEGFLEKNLEKIKLGSSSTEKYISSLKNLLTKIDSMTNMLRQASKDLDSIVECTKNIDNCFDNLAKNVAVEGLDNQIFVSRYLNILKSKSPLHTKTIADVEKAKGKIESTIKAYSAITSQIKREIDIVRDLDSSLTMQKGA